MAWYSSIPTDYLTIGGIAVLLLAWWGWTQWKARRAKKQSMKGGDAELDFDMFNTPSLPDDDLPSIGQLAKMEEQLLTKYERQYADLKSKLSHLQRIDDHWRKKLREEVDTPMRGLKEHMSKIQREILSIKDRQKPVREQEGELR